jgi:Rieske Fe-S protein
MKKLITLLILSLLFAACKTRHVTTTKSDVTTNETLTRSVKKDSTKIDTGKVHTETKTVKNVKDSATVTIIPDSGTVQTIRIDPGQAFTYTGKAKSIVYKKAIDDHSILDEQIQQNKAEITRITEADSVVDDKTVHEVTKTKVTDAKAGYGWIWWIIAIAAAAGLLIFISRKIKIPL